MKISIISSYREACGPAAHTIYLEKALISLGVEVEIIKVDVSLMRSNNSRMKKAVKNNIANMIKVANTSDGVVFQIEPGLYGPLPWVSYSRINKILDSIKVPTLIVLHGFDRPSRVFANLSEHIKNLFRPFKQDVRYNLAKFRLSLSYSYRRFLNRLNKHNVVCFSRTDQHELSLAREVSSNYVPISYLLADDIKRIKNNSNTSRKDLCERLGLGLEAKLILAPGFINEYKNTITTADALQFLPKDYHLIIAGGVHPHSDQLNRALDELLRARSGSSPIPRHFDKLEISRKPNSFFLSKVIEYSSDIRNRIHFIGSLDDDRLNHCIASCDFVVLPYLDTVTGQSGSGPFTLALEIANQSFFGSAGVFRGQDYVDSTSSFVFDSVNSNELAYLLKNADRDKAEYKNFVEKFQKKYNAESQALKYLEILGLKK